MTIHSPYIEVSITALVEDSDGNYTSLQSLDGDGHIIDHFDVEVRKFSENGEIEIIEEHEWLKEDEANRVFEALCAQHPDADHSVNY